MTMASLGPGVRAAFAIVAFAAVTLTPLEGRAQVDITRGRPEVLEKKPQYDTRTAEDDSLGEEGLVDPEAVVVLDAPGAPQSLVRVPPRYPDAASFAAMLRTGKRPDGTAVSTVMPFGALREISDKEVSAMYGFLKTLPPLRVGEQP